MGRPVGPSGGRTDPPPPLAPLLCAKLGPAAVSADPRRSPPPVPRKKRRRDRPVSKSIAMFDSWNEGSDQDLLSASKRRRDIENGEGTTGRDSGGSRRRPISRTGDLLHEG